MKCHTPGESRFLSCKKLSTQSFHTKVSCIGCFDRTKSNGGTQTGSEHFKCEYMKNEDAFLGHKFRTRELLIGMKRRFALTN